LADTSVSGNVTVTQTGIPLDKERSMRLAADP